MDIEAIRTKLAAQPHGERVKIAAATGLSPSWLTRFARGQITDPSVSRMQRLHDHLARKRS